MRSLPFLLVGFSSWSFLVAQSLVVGRRSVGRWLSFVLCFTCVRTHTYTHTRIQAHTLGYYRAYIPAYTHTKTPMRGYVKNAYEA